MSQLLKTKENGKIVNYANSLNRKHTPRLPTE